MRRHRLAAAALAATALLAAPQALAGRPFTVDDLLSAEEFGQVAFDPTGRWLVFETLRGQAVSGPFDLDTYTGARRGRLWVAEVGGAGTPRPLVDVPADAGLTAGPFSPDGRRLAVLESRGEAWRLGVATLETGATRWFDITPELGQLGQTLAWRSPTELVVAARAPGDAPFKLRYGGQARRRLAALWAQAAQGERPTLTVMGSGRFLDRREKGEPGAVLLADAATGAVRTLAKGDYYDLEVSPDGRRVAAMARFEDLQARPEERLKTSASARRRNLVLIDLATGAKTVPCPDCELATHLISWSPDSRRVLSYGRRPGQAWAQARLFSLSEDGVTAPPMPGLALDLAHTSEGYDIPPAAWLDGQHLVRAIPSGSGRADWYRLGPKGPVDLTARLPPPGPRLIALDAHSLTVIADGRAWRVNGAGEARPLFAATGPGPRTGLGLSNRLRVNVAPALGWALAATPGQVRYRSTAGTAWDLAGPARDLLQVAPGPDAIAVVRRRPDQSLALDLEAKGSTHRLMTLNPGFAGIDFARQMSLPGRAPDGQAVTHWLLLPPPAPDGRLPPLVVTPYPGARYDDPPVPYGGGIGHFPVNAEILAAAGFAVLVPSLPRDPDRRELGQGLAEQILAAVDLAAATGKVDATRLALYGQSFGGYGSLMAASQSPRFQAVIAGASPSDLASMYGQFDPHAALVPEDGPMLNGQFGWAELGQGHLGAAPWQAPELYRRNSPLFQVDRITCPVLLIHGDGDFVSIQQAQELFSALYRQGKDAELVTVHGEGHLIAGPANLKAVYGLVLDWLRDVLDPAASRRNPPEPRRPQGLDGVRSAPARPAVAWRR